MAPHRRSGLEYGRVAVSISMLSLLLHLVTVAFCQIARLLGSWIVDTKTKTTMAKSSTTGGRGSVTRDQITGKVDLPSHAHTVRQCPLLAAGGAGLATEPSVRGQLGPRRLAEPDGGPGERNE